MGWFFSPAVSVGKCALFLEFLDSLLMMWLCLSSHCLNMEYSLYWILRTGAISTSHCLLLSPMNFHLDDCGWWRALLHFLFFKKFIYWFLFSWNCLHFLPFPPPHPSQSHLPPPPPPSPFDFVLVSFIVTPIDPSHHYPLPCGYCYNVLNFNVSGYILFDFFFCWLCSS